MKRERFDDPPPKEKESYFARPKTDMDFIASGCKVFDLALGGGWAERRIANVVGDKSTGKTLLAIEASANFASKYPKGELDYRETESAFQKDYAGALGMPISRVNFGDGRMETVEDLFEDLKRVTVKAKKRPHFYIVDSLDALSDREELERAIDADSYKTEKARLMSELFRRLVSQMEQSNLTLMIISQVRTNISAKFGRKVTRTGGRAMDFYASQVAYLSYIGQIKSKVRGVDLATGVEIRAKLDKNKVSLPFREAQFVIQFGFGVDDLGACVDWLADTGGAKNELGFTKDKDSVNKYLDKIEALPKDEFAQAVEKIHKVVEDRWYAMEKTLLPTRKKYGG
jgi:recombination protein RecA